MPMEDVVNSFNLHIIGKHEGCRKLWTVPVVDARGEIQNFATVQEALIVATEKVSVYNDSTQMIQRLALIYI
jgi:hypothetical protein